jgi:serine/threonine-protein kinase
LGEAERSLKLEYFGHYLLADRVADTPWEVIYHAFDSRSRQGVTLKMMSSKLPREVQQKLFLNESESLKMLEHPNIARLLECGELEERFYIVVESLDGPTVRTLVQDKTPMPLGEKLDILAQAADALECAHQHRIVHQSLLPRDIVVLDGRSVRLHGFHLRRYEDDVRSAAEVLFGKVVYLSPEQVKGEGTAAASDIFSLGTILYEFVSFNMPFPGREITSALFKIVGKDPVPIRNFVPDAPDGLLKILDISLNKDPAKRYPTAAAMAEAMRALARSLPT